MEWQEFARRIKEKYPQYNDMADRVLADRLVQKYPEQYADVKESLLADYRQAQSQSQESQAMSAARGLVRGGSMAAEALAQTGQEVSGGFEKVAEKAAEFGPAGGVIGVPALMASEMIPKSKTDIALAAASGPISRGAAAVAGKVAAPFASKITPKLKSIVEIAKAKGIPLSAADITNSQILSAFESFLEKTTLGSGTIREFREKQLAALKTARDSLLARFGPSQETAVVGSQIKDFIKSESLAMNARVNAIYEDMRKMAPPDFSIKLDNLTKKAKELLRLEKQVSPSIRSQEALSVLRDFSGETQASKAGAILGPGGMLAGTPSINLDAMIATRSRLGQLIAESDAAVKAGMSGQKFMSSKEAGIFKQLRSALEKDMEAATAAQGGGLKAAHDLASSSYGEGKEIFNNKTIRRIANSNPDIVVQSLFKPERSTDVLAVKAAVGESGFAPLKQKFAEKVLGEAGDDLRPSAMVRALSKYGDETLRAVFTKSELDEMQNLASVSERLLSAEKLAGNPSGTGRTVVTLATGGMMVNDPITGTMALLGPVPLAKMYMSDIGRKYLSEGFVVPSGSAAAKSLSAKILAFLASKKAAE